VNEEIDEMQYAIARMAEAAHRLEEDLYALMGDLRAGGVTGAALLARLDDLHTDAGGIA
jgi:hypothetical protein